MLKHWMVLSLTTLLMLSACNAPIYNQTESNVADMRDRIHTAVKNDDAKAKPAPALVVKNGLYVDTTPVSLVQQPSWLKSNVIIRGDQLPFSYYSRTVASGAGNAILSKYQPGLDQATNLSVNYNGTVKGALDLLASKTGYTYSIQNNTIYWQAYVTKTFDIAFMPGGTDYLMGNASGGGGSSSASSGGSGGTTQNFTASGSDDEYSNLTGKLSVWDDLKSTIGQLLSPDGKVTVSQSTTTVTVRDRPMNVEIIGQYIQNLNSKLSKQVLVKVQILEVDLSSDYSYGINWGAIANAFHNSPFVMNASYGTPVNISQVFTQQAVGPVPGGGAPAAPAYPQMGFVGNGQTPSYTILVNALSQQGKTSVVSEPRVVCLNNQVSVVRIIQQEGYVASIENTTTSGGGTTVNSNTVTSQVTPGNIITGLTLYILPKIMDNKILMQVNADLSTKKSLIPFGPTSSQVQLPTVAEKHFNQRSVIKSGDTLILSGFRQVGNNANAMQLFSSQAAGGKGAMQENQETVILITPILLTGSA
jgi:type II secretory pathway component GspD/PulD (secretin)